VKTDEAVRHVQATLNITIDSRWLSTAEVVDAALLPCTQMCDISQRLPGGKANERQRRRVGVIETLRLQGRSP